MENSIDSRLFVERLLPDGSRALVHLFHLSLEGLESGLICRDESDYDAMVKNIFICARRNNLIVVIYAVVSNHAHVAVLAGSSAQVKEYSDDLKKVQSMWLATKYGITKLLYRSSSNVSEVDTVRYARNMLAYIPRNAMDNGARSVSEYKWSGYRGMFCGGKVNPEWIRVSTLGIRKYRKIMHSKNALTDVEWLLNNSYELEPVSTCDWRYLEMIYNNDQSFFFRMIGSVNVSDMKYQHSEAVCSQLTDTEFLKIAEEYSHRWYCVPISDMSLKMKVRFMYYLGRKIRLSIPQVARCMNMQRDLVESVLEFRK